MEIDNDLSLNFIQPANDTDAKKQSKTESKSLSSKKGNNSLTLIFN